MSSIARLYLERFLFFIVNVYFVPNYLFMMYFKVVGINLPRANRHTNIELRWRAIRTKALKVGLFELEIDGHDDLMDS